uniref:RING-type domain-containing protein n=1 Tax=Amorphochlora amoebiformis TaxID=1561963 RepID=A0A7S0CPX7_9EUKA|mmetsp:Transcript_11116/g.17578  ORF Transcript_11116/g.17578 Transcript_11116/m.17578 type:complete len:407 (+) Transcript_11116:24-1244(+)
MNVNLKKPMNVNVNISAREGKNSLEQRRSWLGRVYKMQNAKITPEMRSRMKARAERSKRIVKNARRGNKLALHSKIAQRAWQDGYCNILKTREEKGNNRKKKMAQVAQVEVARMNKIQALIEDEEDEMDMARYDDISKEEAKNAVSVQEENSILKDLEKEPKDDEEVKAKFQLYETFLATVEAIRKETFDFWKEAKKEFVGNSKEDIERRLKAIDRFDNMGIDFESRVWFVYTMTRKATKNRSEITQVLKHINQKLSLLAEQIECPVCLETLSGDKSSLSGILKEANLEKYHTKLMEAKYTDKVLIEGLSLQGAEETKFWKEVRAHTGFKPGHLVRLKRALLNAKKATAPKQVQILVCCHKVCSECYANLRDFRGAPHILCPLCRTEDFLGVLLQEYRGLSRSRLP